MRISVLGCGRWATFLGWYANSINHDVMIWGRSNSSNLKRLKEERKNDYLEIEENINLTDSLNDAVVHADYIIISISSQQLRSLSKMLNDFDLSKKTIILAMKGIEKTSGLRLTEVIEEEVKQDIKVAIWVGPGHVQAFTEGIPNCMIISSKQEKVIDEVITHFNSQLIRLYKNKDLIGNEIGAASKNVIGLAAGMLDGLNYSSLKGSLIARGSREVSRLIKAMGGNELTAYGLCHIGDYEATLFSKFSNNRMFGEKFIMGEQFDKLAEGVSTTESLIKLSAKYNVEMPITTAVRKVILESENPQKTLEDLLLRDIVNEF